MIYYLVGFWGDAGGTPGPAQTHSAR